MLNSFIFGIIVGRIRNMLRIVELVIKLNRLIFRLWYLNSV